MACFTIDGSIGCGKSTIMEYIHNTFGVPIDLEPVTEKNPKWIPYLKKMYEQQIGTFEFQTRVWMDRCWMQPKLSSIIIERSPYFQENVFIPLAFKNKHITETENEILHEMYQKSQQYWKPNGYIYLRSNPQNCFERISGRGRECESSIPLEYLINLHELHEAAYVVAAANCIPIVCIDVENKTVAEIGTEVWKALIAFGINKQRRPSVESRDRDRERDRK